jgi:hypothetical protein
MKCQVQLRDERGEILSTVDIEGLNKACEYSHKLTRSHLDPQVHHIIVVSLKDGKPDAKWNGLRRGDSGRWSRC